MTDRRRARRRSIPFRRSAVLETAVRSHIVAVVDLGPEGAFLSTRIAVDPGESLHLKMVLPRGGGEVRIPCQVVWRTEHFDVASGRPAGLAVRFLGLDAGVARRMAEFSTEGFLPGGETIPADHFEYRVLERADVNVEELNRFGLDGWELAGTLPSTAGVRLILQRRL